MGACPLASLSSPGMAIPVILSCDFPGMVILVKKKIAASILRVYHDVYGSSGGTPSSFGILPSMLIVVKKTSRESFFFRMNHSVHVRLGSVSPLFEYRLQACQRPGASCAPRHGSPNPALALPRIQPLKAGVDENTTSNSTANKRHVSLSRVRASLCFWNFSVALMKVTCLNGSVKNMLKVGYKNN